MEILKFSEPPKRSSRNTRTQKSGGLMPLLAVVVSVAVLGGMSTTLAGTISLNSGGSVEFGQGVVTTAACDTTIKVTPASSFETSTSTFSVSTVTLADIGVSGGSDTATAGGGCLGKYMTIRAYDVNGASLNVQTGGAKFVYVKIPATASDASTNTSYATKSTDVTIPAAADFAGKLTADSPAGYFTIGGIKISGTVNRITVESSDVAPSA